MKKLFFISLFLLLPVAHAANDAAPLIADLKKSLYEVPTLEDKMVGMTVANESLMKETSVLDQNRTFQQNKLTSTTEAFLCNETLLKHLPRMQLIK